MSDEQHTGTDCTDEMLKHLRIPVILRDGSNEGKGKLVLLEPSEICNITTDRRGLLFETRDQVYESMTTLDDVAEHFAPLFGFRKVDRSNYVQVDLMKCYDSAMRKVYFEEPITPKSRFATIAGIKLPFIRKLLGKDKDVAVQTGWN